MNRRVTSATTSSCAAWRSISRSSRVARATPSRRARLSPSSITPGQGEGRLGHIDAIRRAGAREVLELRFQLEGRRERCALDAPIPARAGDAQTLCRDGFFSSSACAIASPQRQRRARSQEETGTGAIAFGMASAIEATSASPIACTPARLSQIDIEVSAEYQRRACARTPAAHAAGSHARQRRIRLEGPRRSRPEIPRGEGDSGSP